MKYLYSGPASGVTLRNKDGKPMEVLLWPGSEIDLPSDNEYVKTLIALNHLTPSAQQTPVTDRSRKQQLSDAAVSVDKSADRNTEVTRAS
ncbi:MULTISPECIES: hypothetical protein [Citrobacter]|uniref:Uncharacterized protein n=1 Tax=Citrobacter amalonaticus TaxID=35703 RepID=A0A8I0SWA8_CITAM|nr:MULTISPECIES: hypothetical protein [Citrobacter]MBE0128186.1 hypothetical protein [Citrobacter amalonaticus]MDB2179578.1 hypothetical protein [Citrobacter farmeri]